MVLYKFKPHTLDEKIYRNGDKLMLVLATHKYPGFEPAAVIQLFYAEKISNMNYNVVNEEVFPHESLVDAINAFSERCLSRKPMQAINLGYALETFLQAESKGLGDILQNALERK